MGIHEVATKESPEAKPLHGEKCQQKKSTWATKKRKKTKRMTLFSKRREEGGGTRGPLWREFHGVNWKRKKKANAKKFGFTFHRSAREEQNVGTGGKPRGTGHHELRAHPVQELRTTKHGNRNWTRTKSRTEALTKDTCWLQRDVGIYHKRG